MNIDLAKILQDLIVILTQFGMKLLGALVLWIVGRYLIKFVCNLVVNAVKKQPVDPTIGTYLGSALNVILNVTLVVAILGFFGVETTTFAALLAAAGIAIGTAWSGLLSNFASGAFIIILHPFKVGDFISAGGVIGTVEEIGLFVTTINTMDNVKTFVGNSKIMGDNIQNFTANPFRRVDLVAQLSHSVEPKAAIEMLKERLSKIPNVINNPKPDVEILNFTPMGPVLAVRPYCNNDHYWQVYFDANRVIRDSFGEANYPVPEQHFVMKQVAAK